MKCASAIISSKSWLEATVAGIGKFLSRFSFPKSLQGLSCEKLDDPSSEPHGGAQEKSFEIHDAPSDELLWGSTNYRCYLLGSLSCINFTHPHLASLVLSKGLDRSRRNHYSRSWKPQLRLMIWESLDEDYSNSASGQVSKYIFPKLHIWEVSILLALPLYIAFCIWSMHCFFLASGNFTQAQWKY
ncbi:uncharacterized protein LOC109947648 isoform X1 [Prunus persica]|uniref:uncharacterized protein LOC109947648 isoform X1 n=1 Tax=Prunus persica TaxID=3760 RepID=UPI0009AB4E67|nr:uncharacterized protein LOC109947648 isoform X1 [Prunus persica]